MKKKGTYFHSTVIMIKYLEYKFRISLSLSSPGSSAHAACRSRAAAMSRGCLAEERQRTSNEAFGRTVCACSIHCKGLTDCGPPCSLAMALADPILISACTSSIPAAEGFGGCMWSQLVRGWQLSPLAVNTLQFVELCVEAQAWSGPSDSLPRYKLWANSSSWVLVFSACFCNWFQYKAFKAFLLPILSSRCQRKKTVSFYWAK